MDNKIISERTNLYAPGIHVVMSVTITGSPSEENLRSAIQIAIRKHDMFFSRIILDSNGDSYYKVTDQPNVSMETRNVVKEDDWKQIVKEQARIPFHFMEGELIRFYLLKYGQEVKKLLIIAHHLAGDGLADIFLIRDIMTALGNPQITYERQSMQLLGLNFPKASRLSPWVRFVSGRLNKSWNKNKKIFQYEDFLKMFHSYWSSRNIEVLDAELCGPELTKLIDLCRSKKVTVNSAISTAFLLAAKGENNVGFALSIRPDGYEGMGNYASGFTVTDTPNRSKSFWDNAAKLHKLIYKKLNNINKRYFLLHFLSGLEPTLTDAAFFSTYAGFQNRTAEKVRDIFGFNGKQNGISITNLTKPKIPSIYGKYAIDSIEFVPPLIAKAKQVIGVVTVEDKLTITMQYEVKEGSGEMENMFREAVQILRNV